MKKFIVLVLIVGGIWYWQKGGSHKAPVDASGKPVVVVYTASGCGPCVDEVNMLAQRGVPFQEKEIDPGNEQDADVKVWRDMGNNQLPMTLYADGKVLGYSKWELIALLGEHFGDQYLLPAERNYFRQHFDDHGSPKIVLYGTDWCPTCAGLRKQFNEHGDSFVDVDVEKSGDFANMTRVMEIPGYPAVWVGYTRVHGVSYGDVKSVVNKRT